MELYDPYGTLAAALIGIRMHEQHTRASGRTEAMMALAMETGGTVVCTSNTRQFVELIIRKRGRARNRLIAVSPDPARPNDLYHAVRHGPVYFDHDWLTQMWEAEIKHHGKFLRGIIERYPSPLHVITGPMDALADEMRITRFMDTPMMPYKTGKIEP